MKSIYWLFALSLLVYAPRISAQMGATLATINAEKVSCGPCEDYYGYGYGPSVQVLVIPDSVPGIYHFFHVEDPDTGTTYAYGQWGFPHDSTSITSYPGDTISLQFPQNGVYQVYFYAYYVVPSGICTRWGSFEFTVTGMPFQAITAAPEELTSASINGAIAFPNPVRTTLSIAWDHPDAQKTTATLFNLAGQQMKQGLRFQNGLLAIDMQSLPSGYYEIVLTTGKQVKSIKVLRQ